MATSSTTSTVIPRNILSLAGATTILQAALDKAEALGVPMAIAVVDAGGGVIAVARQDGSPLSSVRLAIAKATTSIDVANSTQKLWDFMQDDQELVIGLGADSALTVIGGGVPVMVDGDLVGAVGTSGGHYTDDVTVAEHAAGVVAS